VYSLDLSVFLLIRNISSHWIFNACQGFNETPLLVSDTLRFFIIAHPEDAKYVFLYPFFLRPRFLSRWIFFGQGFGVAFF